MNLSQLKYLHLIVSRGSFAAAAQEAGVSQPAVTQAMQALEKTLGVVLFDKVGRNKRPTAAALEIAQHMAKLHRQLEGLADRSSGASQATPQGPMLRIGMAPAAALLYGSTIEQVWRQHEPEGLLQVLSGNAQELLADLAQGELDLAIAPRPRRYQAAGLRHRVMHTSEPTVYARIGHPLLGARSLREIGQAGWAVSGRGGTAGNVIEEAHRVRRLPAPRILVQCADYMTLLDLVAKTDLLCVVPHPVLLQKRPQGAVRALQILEGLPQYEVCLFWAPGRDSPGGAAVQAVVEAVVGEADAPSRGHRGTR